MALNRWSLEQLLAWAGMCALMVLFVPMGLFLVSGAVTSAEDSLTSRTEVLGTTLAVQVVEPILLEKWVLLHEILQKAASCEPEVRYLCIENAQGQVVAHNFPEGPPESLREYWKSKSAALSRLRTPAEPVLDAVYPILDGQLGRVRLGMSRQQASRAVDRVTWAMGIVLAGGLAVVLAGARIMASWVSRPLRRLETAVSSYPQQPLDLTELRPSGTQEVTLLAKGFKDLAERLEALERDRESTQERMVHAERLAALGQLAAGLAHEVHNPLDGMQECVRFLQADPDISGRGAKYYPMLRDGLERIARVMREMLTLARSGRKLSLEAHKVPEILQSLELLVKADMQGRKVHLEWEAEGDCSCLCDAQSLFQTGLNLALNAAEAASKRPDPRVRVRALCDSEWVFLTFEDSGPGVPPDLREKIFEPFFSTKPIGQGTGLGLWVSRNLIRAGGGELELSPEPSVLGGARFVVKLPKVC